MCFSSEKTKILVAMLVEDSRKCKCKKSMEVCDMGKFEQHRTF